MNIVSDIYIEKEDFGQANNILFNQMKTNIDDIIINIRSLGTS